MQAAQKSLYDARFWQGWLTVRRYYSVNHQFFEMAPHAHTELEIMYVASGRCTITLPDGPHSLREGEYVFLDSLTPHDLRVERGSPCRVLNIEAEPVEACGPIRLGPLTADRRLRGLLAAEPSAFVCEDRDGILRTALINLMRLMQRHPEVSDNLEADLQLALILLELGGQYAEGRRRRELGVPAYIRRAALYIGECYDQDITVDDIARAAGVSRSHLQRTFHEALGCTIVGRITELRLEKAKYLLETSTLPVADVASGVGYNSRQHFSEVFTKYIGYTPAYYRAHRTAGNLSRGHYKEDWEKG